MKVVARGVAAERKQYEMLSDDLLFHFTQIIGEMIMSKLLNGNVAKRAGAVCALLSAVWFPIHAAHAGMHDHSAHDDNKAVSKPAEQGAFPSLRILSPKPNEKLGRVITVEFETPADLAKMTMGAGMVGVHLHLDLDGAVMMPASSDLTRTAKDRYRYTFDLPVKPGAHTVKVYWSDGRHQAVEASVQSVRFMVVEGQSGDKQ
jgi:hypothetical protein